MTDPLIDRDFLAEVIENSVDPFGIDWNEVAADEVIAYLRSVLTPEALEPNRGTTVVVGARLHRRIFGEDK